MKPFELQSNMLTLSGAFYPKGYAVVMLDPSEDVAQVADKLERGGFDSQHILHIPPQVMIRQIGKVDGESDIPLPSVGTEGHTVHQYVKLAREGHQALMVHAPTDKDTEKLMKNLEGVQISYAQKYHLLAIEDLM